MTTKHCILTLLWSSCDDAGVPLDAGTYEPSPELLAQLEQDWHSFKQQAESAGFDPDEQLTMMLHPDNDGDAWNAVAHDFVLTRNGHGTGFWDAGRWHAPWNYRLTTMAHGFGSIDVCVGDDGLIYC